MRHPLPPLDSLKAFEAAARHLSFSLAADELCVSKGAISYQIRKLEAHLQCSLFKRGIRHIYLTDAGQSLLHSTVRWFEELRETQDKLRDTRHSAAVSVATSTYVAARWLSPHIAAFGEQHPSASIWLHHTVNSADFKLFDVDLAIRWGPCHGKPDRNRFGQMPMPLYPAASPALLHKLGLRGDVSLSSEHWLDGPLATVTLLCEDRPQDLWQEWISRDNGAGVTLQNPRRVISDANVRAQAAIDGQGFILADALMINELNNGLLHAPFAHQLSGYGYVLMHAPNRMLSEHAQSFKHWLGARVG